MAALDEVTWADNVCRKLNRALVDASWGRKLEALARKRIPYRNEIFSYRANAPEAVLPTDYQTDLVIIERLSADTWLPRIVIEGKLRISAHDALTYDSKAAAHKNVHPYLRYGILIGGLDSVPLRLYRHGLNFDFMITWLSHQARPRQWADTIAIVRDEINASRQIESLLSKTSKKARCTSVHRRLIFS